MTGPGMTGVTIPIIETEWLAFKARVLDRSFKAMGPPHVPPAFFTEMLHNAFYAGALTLFSLEQKSSDEVWKTLVGQVEAYYREAVLRVSAPSA